MNIVIYCSVFFYKGLSLVTYWDLIKRGTIIKLQTYIHKSKKKCALDDRSEAGQDFVFLKLGNLDFSEQKTHFKANVSLIFYL